MTMEPIRIPHFNHYARRAQAAARMSGSARRGVRGLMFANRIESAMERPAIRGLAVRYGEVFTFEGHLHAFMPGCFSDSLASGEEIDVRVDHEASTVLGSTASGLRFVDTAEGLAFDYEPPRDMQGALAISLVASDNRTDVSVGARQLTTVVRNIRGHDVRLITKARLAEISLCKDGLVPTAHSRVVDLDTALPLEAEAETTIMRTTALANDLKTGVKRLAATVDTLSGPLRQRSYPIHHIWGD